MAEFRSGSRWIAAGTGPDSHQFAAPAQGVLTPVLQSPELPRLVASRPGADGANQWIADYKRSR
jgi:hypothetical protein